jgi:hypothetical protein
MENTVVKPRPPFLQRLKENKGLLLAIVSFAQMLDIINMASVTIVLPDVMRDVGFQIDQLQWYVSTARRTEFPISVLATNNRYISSTLFLHMIKLNDYLSPSKKMHTGSRRPTH